MILIQTTIWTFIVIYYVQPYTEREFQRIEVINEICISLVFYTFLCFNDLVLDLHARGHIATTSCILVSVHILVNILIVFYQNVRHIHIRC